MSTTTAIGFVLLGGLAILALIAANGFFVAQEFAYMSVDRNRLRTAAESGDGRAQAALKITERTSFMLSGAQLGITVTGLLVGFVAEPFVGEGLGALLGDVGVPAAVSVTVGTVLALLISTVVQMIFGELFPKNYTIAAPMKSALVLARPTRIYLLLFGWIVHFFDWSANSFLKLVRIQPVEDVDSSATAEDLEHIVATSRETGDLTDEEFLTIDRMLDFPEQDVEHAMIPRTRADVVDPETTIGEVRTLMATEHTRYPVIDEEHNPVGVVHMLDVMSTPHASDEPVTVIMREPCVLPELMSLPDAVSELRRRSERLACVIDEYGGFTGLLSMEDIAEEVFGELVDEHDDEEETEEITAAGENTWILDGDVHVDELERAIGSDLPEGEYETVAGLLIAEYGSLPEEGQTHDVELPAQGEDFLEDDEPEARLLRLTVQEIDHHVPSVLRAELIEPERPGDEDARETDERDEAGEGDGRGEAGEADGDRGREPRATGSVAVDGEETR
ncbi:MULTISPECIES: hemolysin family protein [unclassified Brachybacterium]|uniref:hemolysin family protein n=1 Tax=unclassified Brachybacterium TaxID=2623841 RepID=UPI0018ED7DF2|nr:hemolysin family protein [Brachybacterium sp. UMB0905]